MDDMKAKEETALAQIAREESESKERRLIIPKRLVLNYSVPSGFGDLGWCQVLMVI